MPKATDQGDPAPADLQENRYYDLDNEEDEEGRPGGPGRGPWRAWGRRLTTTLRDHPFLGALLLLQAGLIAWLTLRPAPPPPALTRTPTGRSESSPAASPPASPPAYSRRPDPFAALPGLPPEGTPAEPPASGGPPALAQALTRPTGPAPVFGAMALTPGSEKPPGLSGPMNPEPGLGAGNAPGKPAGPATPEVTLRGIARYGEQRLAVLAAGSEVFFKREGEVLGDGSWRVVRIARDQVVVETPTGERMTLRLK